MRVLANVEDPTARPVHTSRWASGFPLQRLARNFQLRLPQTVRPAMLSMWCGCLSINVSLGFCIIQCGYRVEWVGLGQFKNGHLIGYNAWLTCIFPIYRFVLLIWILTRSSWALPKLLRYLTFAVGSPEFKTIQDQKCKFVFLLLFLSLFLSFFPSCQELYSAIILLYEKLVRQMLKKNTVLNTI